MRTRWWVAVVLGAALVACGPTPLGKMSANTVSARCEDAVRDQLKAPSSAKFVPGASAAYVGTAWRVEGAVDAQNSFGAMLRTRYRCDATGTTSDDLRVVAEVQEGSGEWPSDVAARRAREEAVRAEAAAAEAERRRIANARLAEQISREEKAWARQAPAYLRACASELSKLRGSDRPAELDNTSCMDALVFTKWVIASIDRYPMVENTVIHAEGQRVVSIEASAPNLPTYVWSRGAVTARE